jgi:hypothetical protein
MRNDTNTTPKNITIFFGVEIAGGGAQDFCTVVGALLNITFE